MRLPIHLVLAPALLAACLGPGQAEVGRGAAEEAPDEEARSVILLVGDGMGPQQVGFAMLHRRLRRPADPPLNLERMMSSSHLAVVTTFAHGEVVTDSAAAATAMSCGKKARNDMVGLDADGYDCEHILERAERAGKATGLVTTVTITHATPAGFSAHEITRQNETDVAVDLLDDHEIEVLMGGGVANFIPRTTTVQDSLCGSRLSPIANSGRGKRTDSRDLLAEARELGYTDVCNEAELAELPADTDKLLGLFGPGHLPAAPERLATGTNIPTLGEMAQGALRVLERDPDGFFLMIEGAQIDFAGHQNDAGTMLQEILDFDEAIGVALAYQASHPDTLVIVTADHETGSFGMSYSGSSVPGPVDLPSGKHYEPSHNHAAFDRLDAFLAQDRSYAAIVAAADGDPERLVSEVDEHTAYTIDPTEAQQVLAGGPGGNWLAPTDFADFYPYPIHNASCRLARVLGAEQMAVWGTGTHTATPVYALAQGPSATSFRGIIDNTDISRIVGRALRIDP